MNERPVAYTLLVLPLAWVGVLVLTDVARVELVATLIAFALTAALGIAGAVRKTFLGGWGALVLLGLAGVALGASFSGPLGFELALGILLGLPWILVGYAAGADRPLGARFLALGGALALGLMLLAARSELAVGSGAVTAESLVRQVGTVLQNQSQVFGSLVPGAPTPSIPLLDLFDPVYVGLSAVAVLGLLLVSVRPQTGAGRRLPISLRLGRGETLEGRRLPVAYGFSTAQQAVFFERTPVEPPLGAWPPGLASVLAGALAASAFLIASYAIPLSAVLAATVVLAVASVALVLVTERPGLLRAPRVGARRRRIFVRAGTPRVTRELLTSPSLPVNDPERTPSPADR